MDGPRGYHGTKISQTEKVKHCTIFIMCGIEKYKRKSKHRVTENGLVVSRDGEWGMEEMNGGGIS